MKLVLVFWAVLLCATALAADLPNPALIVLVKGANELAIVDPSSLTVVARVATGEAPHEVAISPDGKTGFVANYGVRSSGNSISVTILPLEKRRSEWI